MSPSAIKPIPITARRINIIKPNIWIPNDKRFPIFSLTQIRTIIAVNAMMKMIAKRSSVK